jgi:hypothetical protein
MDVAGLYRRLGPAIFARCRRLLGDDARAAQATPRVFVRAQGRLTGDAVRDDEVLARTAQAVCADLPGPRLVRDPAPLGEAELARAAERFARDVYAKTLLLVERDQRPPAILRWVWVYAPILVAVAMTGMFFAVRNPMNPERFGGGSRAAGVELYRETDGMTARLATGMRVRRGDRLRVVVAPSGFPFATVSVGPRVHARLGPLARDAGRIDVAPVVVDTAPFRVSALFGRSPRGLPVTETSIVLEVE